MKYKIDYSKCRIQFGFEWVFDSCRRPNDYRYIYWRIHPSEMTWWDRTFKNPWRQFRYAIYDDLNDIYDPRQFKEELSQIKTYEQALEYQNSQCQIVRDYCKEKQDAGEYWPDKLND